MSFVTGVKHWMIFKVLYVIMVIRYSVATANFQIKYNFSPNKV